MDFLTSSILGGFVYDGIKRGFNEVRYKLSDYTNDNDLIEKLIDILNKKNIPNDIKKDNLIEILDSDKEIKNVIYDINHTYKIKQKGNGNIINFYNNIERELSDTEIKSRINNLPKSEKKFKLVSNFILFISPIIVLIMFGLIIFILIKLNVLDDIDLFSLGFYSWKLFIIVIIIPIIIIFGMKILFDKISVFLFPSITIYQDKFLLKNQVICYSDIEDLYSIIENFKTDNRKIIYQFKKDKNQDNIIFSSNKGVNYLEKQYDTYQKAMKF